MGPEFESPADHQSKRAIPLVGYGPFALVSAEEIRKIKMQPSGGRLLATARRSQTIIFAIGKNANESPAGHMAQAIKKGRSLTAPTFSFDTFRRGVLQSAANLVITMIAGGNHTLIPH